MARTGLCRQCGETHDGECELIVLSNAEKERLKAVAGEPKRRRKLDTAELGPVKCQPAIGAHMATLNLFREADGTYEITVAEARGFMATQLGVAPLEQPPIHYIEEAIIAAAERIKSRHAGVKPG
jgi:hypothetical protein